MILNLPNILAFIRVLLAPLMLYILLIAQSSSVANAVHVGWYYYLAALIFVIASVTDFFDGFIARELDQKTKLGAILDPLADKMLMLAAFIGLASTGMANVWAIYIIIVRELFITGLRTAIVAEGLNVAASWSGKVKTVVQMIAVGFLLMQWSGGNELLWLAVIFTLYSGYEYVSIYVQAIKKKESA